MRGFEVFLVLALTGVCVFAKLEDGLKVKFDVGLHPGTGDNFFYHMPLNKSAAIASDWKLTERSEDKYRSSLVLFCKGDQYELCEYFDKDTGRVEGTRICMPQDEFTDAVFDWAVQGFSTWTSPTKEGEPIREYQCTSQFFCSEDYLKKSVEERLAICESTTKILKEGYIWVKGINGVLDKWSTKTSELEKSKWTKQGCLMWMGQHYYYDMSPETPCDPTRLYPYFPLTDQGEIVGMGCIMFGKWPAKEGKPYYCENPPELAVKLIVPKGPQCLYEMANNPGLVTMHTYYVNNPWNIGCSLFG